MQSLFGLAAFYSAAGPLSSKTKIETIAAPVPCSGGPDDAHRRREGLWLAP